MCIRLPMKSTVDKDKVKVQNCGKGRKQTVQKWEIEIQKFRQASRSRSEREKSNEFLGKQTENSS